MTRPKGEWRGGRDGYVSQSDDWVWLPRWRYKMILLESACSWPAAGYHGLVNVPDRYELELTVHGRERGGSVRATHYLSKVVRGTVESYVRGHITEARARSVKEAQRKALGDPLLPAVMLEVRLRSYDPKRTTSVYRLEDGRWVPWASIYCFDYQPSTFPVGTYALIQVGSAGGRLLHVRCGGYSSMPGDDEIAHLHHFTELADPERPSFQRGAG